MNRNQTRAIRSALVVLSGLGALVTVASQPGAPAPSPAAVLPAPAGADLADAERTTAVLANALVAAVASISDATPPGSSADHISAASEAVSLLVPDRQRSHRLLDASGDPLDPGNEPRGRFEREAMDALLAGEPVVQEVVGPFLRTVVPLTNDMHPNCATCHTNYDDLPAGTVIGAASFRVRR